MKPLEELYKDLEKYKDFDADPDNTEKFLDTVDAIVLKKDPSSIAILFQYFDDESDYDWVMEEIRGAIEYYPDENYVKELLLNISRMIPKSVGWLKGFFYATFNHDNCRQLFRQHMHLADRNALLKLFDIMEEESPHHAALIQELRHELKA